MKTIRKKLFELQELQLCWHFCSRNIPRSILQEPSELANQISLDNLLQRSAALKEPRVSLFGKAGCTQAGIWDSASHGKEVNLKFLSAQVLPPCPWIKSHPTSWWAYWQNYLQRNHPNWWVLCLQDGSLLYPRSTKLGSSGIFMP